MTPVDSETIAAVRYDGYTLFILFHTSEDVYPHPGVPESVFAEFMQASSKGAYYNKHIRGRYQ